MGTSPSHGGGPVTRRSGRTTAEVKVWVTEVTTENQINLQRRIIDFLLPAYGGLLLATITLYVLQGFKPWGFSLPESVLKWLGGATIGEIGGLLTLTIGAVFKGRSKGS